MSRWSEPRPPAWGLGAAGALGWAAVHLLPVAIVLYAIGVGR